MCYALKHHQLAIAKALVEECGCSLEMRTQVRLECESPTACMVLPLTGAIERSGEYKTLIELSLLK